MVPALLALIAICLMAGCRFPTWSDPHHQAGRHLRWTAWSVRRFHCPHTGYTLLDTGSHPETELWGPSQVFSEFSLWREKSESATQNGHLWLNPWQSLELPLNLLAPDPHLSLSFPSLLLPSPPIFDILMGHKVFNSTVNANTENMSFGLNLCKWLV